jgi:hypothetical protein
LFDRPKPTAGCSANGEEEEEEEEEEEKKKKKKKNICIYAYFFQIYTLF